MYVPAGTGPSWHARFALSRGHADNYAHLVIEGARAAVVDPGEAPPIEAAGGGGADIRSPACQLTSCQLTSCQLGTGRRGRPQQRRLSAAAGPKGHDSDVVITGEGASEHHATIGNNTRYSWHSA